MLAHPIQLVPTADGTYTARIQETHTTLWSEPMHSLQGAFLETQYVYQPVLQHVLQNQWPLVFLSVGLGLGYIEILAAGYFLSAHTHNPTPEALFSQIHWHSFETQDFLKHEFVNFLHHENPQSPLHRAYRSFINTTAQHYQINSALLIATLNKWIHGPWFQFHGPYTGQKSHLPYVGMMFDAFSPHSSPNLWQTSLLHNMLNSADHKAVFATYAARTELKKLLQNAGFQVPKRKGFGTKRECTLAIKNP